MYASFQSGLSGIDLYEAARGIHALDLVSIVAIVDNGYKSQGMHVSGRFIQANTRLPALKRCIQDRSAHLSSTEFDA